MARNPKFDLKSLPERPDLLFELSLWESGFKWVAGIDEAGRGALAGPVSVGIVILPASPHILETLSGVRDSKEMDPKSREYWKDKIQQSAASCSVGFADNQEIDRFGIVEAVKLAVRRGLECIKLAPDYLLMDYFKYPELSLPQTALVKGDARSLSIAAASILAKTHRDAWMKNIDPTYPEYGFASHKGYGTAMHCRAIETFGYSPLHRMSYHLHSKKDQ